MPKKSRRAKQKFPALNPEYNLKTRTEQIDYDYLNKLNDEEKAWLNKFTEEYTNASFSKTEKDLNPSRKESYDRNNARNRDLYSRDKAGGSLVYVEDIKEYTVEDLDVLDQFNSAKKNADDDTESGDKL